MLEVYEVQPGDGLAKIAEQFGVTIDALMVANGITDPDHIEAGQKLNIPPPTPTPTTAPATTTTSA